MDKYEKDGNLNFEFAGYHYAFGSKALQQYPHLKLIDPSSSSEVGTCNEKFPKWFDTESLQLYMELVNSSNESQRLAALPLADEHSLQLVMKVIWLSDYFMTFEVQEFVLEHYVFLHINHNSALFFLNEALKKVRSSSSPSKFSLSGLLWWYVLEKASLYVVFGMREKLKVEESRDKILKKIGFRGFSNCYSYLLNNNDYQSYLTSHIKLQQLIAAFTKKSSLSEVFNLVKEKTEEVFKSTNKPMLNLKFSFKRKHILEKGSIGSRPFRLGSHWWLLSVSVDPTDTSYFRIHIEYFKPSNPQRFNLHHLRSIFNLDSPGTNGPEDGNEELDCPEIFGTESRLDCLNTKREPKRSAQDLLQADNLKLVSRCVLPQVVFLRANVLDHHNEIKPKKSSEFSRQLIVLCMEGENAEIGELTVPQTHENLLVEVVLENSPFLSVALSDILYASIAGCKRPKKTDVSEFAADSEQEIMVLVKLFRYINNGSEQDAALIISDYGKASLTQRRALIKPHLRPSGR